VKCVVNTDDDVGIDGDRRAAACHGGFAFNLAARPDG
jgi:hypothetical protein